MHGYPGMDLLFDPALIPVDCHQSLPGDLLLRPLAVDDYSRGHFELLSVLTVAPALSKAAYQGIFATLKAASKTTFTVVLVDKTTDRLVAIGTILLERKFVRNGGIVGHIEDIAVSKSMQGRKLGLKIISTLEAIGRSQGCYKIILDCSKENIPFYEKCGFKHKEYEMVMYMADTRPIEAKL